jgi:hypothetical protein
MAACTSGAVAPTNGRRPDSNSYSTQPDEKMSERASVASPLTCSGDM